MINLDIHSIYGSHFNIKYRNIPAVKCPFDYVILQMILNEVKPDLVIEIGTLYGGTALYIADILNTLQNGIVHTLDIEHRVIDSTVVNHERIRYFSSGGYATYDLSLTEGFEKILVIDDGSHNYEDVKASLEKFKNIVSVGSYFIVEDGAIIDTLGIRNTFNGGPIPAIEEFLKTNSDFIIDYRWTNFFGPTSTFNGIGYLKKI